MLSVDEMHLLEIPEPPEIVFKSENPSNCNSSVISGVAERKNSLDKSAAKAAHNHQCHFQQQQHQQLPSQPSSTIFESENEPNVPEIYLETPASDKSSLNDLKNTIQKLENELTETKRESESVKRINTALEEKLTNELVTKKINGNVELIEMKKTMSECEQELQELRQQYMELQTKTEIELDEAQHKIGLCSLCKVTDNFSLNALQRRLH